MGPTASDIARLLVREVEGFKRELALFPDDESVWKTAPGVANSAGTLALHIAGNLQHYVGAVLGGTGYVRNRDAEFSRRSVPRSELIAELDRAAAVVRDVVPGLDDARLGRDFPERMLDGTIRTGLFLHHLAVHAGFHLGQAGYVRRVVTGSAQSSQPIPLAPLIER